jgi:hypothetical protein
MSVSELTSCFIEGKETEIKRWAAPCSRALHRRRFGLEGRIESVIAGRRLVVIFGIQARETHDEFEMVRVFN